MKLSEELELLNKYIYTSMDLSVPTNDFENRKQQLFNSNNKIIDPIINQQIFDILQEQIKQFKQSFDHVLIKHKQQQPKEQSANSDVTNELSNDTKELQDQVKIFIEILIQFFISYFFRSLNYVHY
jgi:excinuclease UvrABC helicase subunit UvrB